MVPINYLAVLIAAVAAMVVGFLWYGPLFGKKWMAEIGATPDQIEAAKAKGMGKTYAMMIVSTLIMSYVMAHSMVFAIEYLKIGGLAAGFQGGFWNWLGFVMPVTLGSVLWDGKSWTYWFITAGYYLVSFIIMATILAYWV